MIDNFLLLKAIFLKGVEACDNDDFVTLANVINSVIIISEEIKKCEEDN